MNWAEKQDMSPYINQGMNFSYPSESPVNIGIQIYVTICFPIQPTNQSAT